MLARGVASWSYIGCLFATRQWGYALTKNSVYRTLTLPITVKAILGVWATMVGVSDDVVDGYHVMWNDQNSTTSMIQVNVGRSTGASPMVIILCR